MLQNFQDGTIEWFVDDGRKIAFVNMIGDLTGADLIAGFSKLCKQHSQAALYCAIYDQRAFTGIIEVEAWPRVLNLRAEIVGGQLPTCRVAIVSHDPMRNLEVKGASARAPAGREIRTFEDNASALEWIAEQEPNGPRARDGTLPWWFNRMAPTR